MNITGEIQLVEACFKEVWFFTHREIHNICNGNLFTIPYGIYDYLPIVFIFCLIMILIAGTIFVFKQVF